MTTDAPATSASSAVDATAPVAPHGRLALLTGFAAAATSIPIPFLPDRVLARIRGAVVHDITSRRGLSLTSDARDCLAEPSPAERAVLRRAAEGLSRQLLRRLRPIGVIASVGRGFEVYALGHLLERYLTRLRPTGSIRIQAEEARRIRGLIDKATARALSPALQPAGTTLPSGSEDLRDEFTRWIDTLLLTGAALPGYIERRLEAAFDGLASGSDHVG